MTTLMLSHDHVTAVMESSLCGAAMATNHAAAAAVGVLIDTPMHEVAEQLSSLRAVPGCGQRIAGFDQPTVILDRAGTAERAATTLRTYRSMKSGGKLWCILAVDDNDTPEQLADYGNLLERFCDHGIVTTTAKSKPRFLATAHAVMDGVEKCAALRLVADRQRAISWAIAEAGSADTIVVLAGFEGQTPHERRDEIERMKHFIESQQELRSNESPQASEADPPIILKIADCEE